MSSDVSEKLRKERIRIRKFDISRKKGTFLAVLPKKQLLIETSSDVNEKLRRKRIQSRGFIIARERDTAIKYASLVVLVIQNASQVLVMRYVRTRPREMFLSTVAVLLTEVAKLFTCFLLIIAEEKSMIGCMKLMHEKIVKQPIDTLKVCVPAVLYVIQNNLLYVAVSNLSAATYMVTYQLKILTTAIFTVIILRRRLSLLQWLALIFLFGGVALVQMDEQKSKELAKIMKENITSVSNNVTAPTKPPVIHDHIVKQSSIKGFIAVLVACILSGFAGIYFEKILKTSDVSVWIRNVQLAIISLPVGLANVLIQDGEIVFERGMLVGFDILVWVVILLSSVGGLTVAVVIKYADNILKAFATSIAIVVACVVSTILFAFRPSILFLVGTVFVIGAVFIYSMFPYKKKYQQAPAESLPETHQKEEAAAL